MHTTVADLGCGKKFSSFACIFRVKWSNTMVATLSRGSYALGDPGSATAQDDLRVATAQLLCQLPVLSHV